MRALRGTGSEVETDYGGKHCCDHGKQLLCNVAARGVWRGRYHIGFDHAFFVVARNDHEAIANFLAQFLDLLRRGNWHLRPDESILYLTALEVKKTAEHRSEDTRLNSSHVRISYAVFCLKKKKKKKNIKTKKTKKKHNTTNTN